MLRSHLVLNCPDEGHACGWQHPAVIADLDGWRWVSRRPVLDARLPSARDVVEDVDVTDAAAAGGATTASSCYRRRRTG